MKKIVKKIMAVMLVILMSVTVVSTGDMEVQATQKFSKNITLTLYSKTSELKLRSWFCLDFEASKVSPITNIKSSDTKIVKASNLKSAKHILVLEAKSVGKAKVTFKYKGKKYTANVVVNQYENPCKQFKVGKKNYAKYYNESNNYTIHGTSKKREKISIKPKNGWKIMKITRGFKGGEKKIKNNSYVELTSEYTGSAVYVYFKNKKTKIVQKVSFGYGNTGGRNYNWYD